MPARVTPPNATPAPTAPKIKLPGPTPKATPPKIAIPKPTAQPTAPKNIAPVPKPTATATAPKLKMPDAKPTPTPPKLGIPKATPAATPPKDIAPKPTATPKKKLVPGPQDWKPAPKPVPTAPPLKGPQDKDPGNNGKGSKWKGKSGWNVWINIDVNPPPPTVIYVPSVPVYQAVQRSEVVHVQGGIAPVPEDYTPPAEAPPQEGPTALRAWNGDPAPETRKFDQTRVKVIPAPDGTSAWQFFWQTSGAEPQAARWEVATVPFVGGVETFPPAGLVAYGDASLDAEIPAMANFFAIDFGALTQGIEDAPPLRQVYMRVVPVDGDGKPVVAPSNFVRIDLP